MNRDSNSSIIPKIIIFLGSIGIIGIILLFFRDRPIVQKFRDKVIPPPSKLFAQVIAQAIPEIQSLWENGDRFLTKEGTRCPNEIVMSEGVGRSYYQCQPHFWQCYWEGGVVKNPEFKIETFGRTFHVRAKPSFEQISAYSQNPRFYKILKRPNPGINLHYGMVVELEVKEIPGISQSMILADSCRDTFLPERIYGYGKAPKKDEKEFLWDNFKRNIFIDRFYVSNQQVNEWRVLRGDYTRVIKDRLLWPQPAILALEDQKKYCHFFGKKLLEAKLFDAATMAPVDTKDVKPEQLNYPQTPWMRDHSKSFLGMAKINPDYQLSPLDCQLAQVEGCKANRFYTTDSATWMGIYFALGFYPESLQNPLNPKKNLKLSSKFLAASSEWHELGSRSYWSGIQGENDLSPVAFRCYEEVSL